MRHVLALPAAAAALLAVGAPIAAATPDPDPGYDGVTYLIGKCWDPSQPVTEEPTQVVYNCDGTSAMENMQWTSWGADATGTGTDNSVDCQPNCATGARLFNPIVVHAWNPQTVAGCPPNLQFYSDITIAYPQGVPPWIKPGMQWSPDTYFVTIDNMPAVHFINQGVRSCTPMAS